MTTEELNKQLYQKTFDEQACFKFQLLALPPAQILERAYEYTIREDILLSLEYNDLTAKQASALRPPETGHTSGSDLSEIRFPEIPSHG